METMTGGYFLFQRMHTFLISYLLLGPIYTCISFFQVTPAILFLLARLCIVE